MKKRINCFLMLIFLLFTGTKVYALEVSKNEITIPNGGSDDIELYINSDKAINHVDFTLVYTTYDIPANFTVAPNFTDTNPNGIKHSIIFNEAKTGKILLGTIKINVVNNPTDKYGSISIHSVTSRTPSGEVSEHRVQTINVKVGTPEPVEKKEEPTPTKTEPVDNNLLEKIESEIVTIELKKDVFEYNVTIKNSVTELDLKPVAKDKDTKVEITTQKIKEIKDNKIVITAKNGDVEQKYNIIFKTKKEANNIEKPAIDNEEFKEDKSYRGKWLVLTVIFAVVFVISLIFSRKK